MHSIRGCYGLIIYVVKIRKSTLPIHTLLMRAIFFLHIITLDVLRLKSEVPVLAAGYLSTKVFSCNEFVLHDGAHLAVLLFHFNALRHTLGFKWD